MSLKPGLKLKFSNRLILTPSLRQSLSVLAMSEREIETLVEQELSENPLLSADSPVRTLGHVFDPSSIQIAQEKSLYMSLWEQISLSSAPERIRQLAIRLVGELDEAGWLSESDQSLIEGLNIDAEDLTEGVRILQSCEPVGIGARSLLNCLELQLADTALSGAEQTLLVANLGLFASGDHKKIRRKLGLSSGEIERFSNVLSTLDPYPAQTGSQHEDHTLQPDVRILRSPDGQFFVEDLHSTADKLSIDTSLLESSRNSGAEAFEYAQSQADRAKSLIRALEARSKTVLRVCLRLVEEQTPFFLSGPAHLQPMTQVDMASNMSLHPSTITRAIAGKSLACDFGVFPLSFFFNRPIRANKVGTETSANLIKLEIRRIIGNETGKNVLTDAQITALLLQGGIDIARRTVANYRQSMKIPPSSRRRRLK